MKFKKLYTTLFLPFIIGIFAMSLATGCSDDNDELQGRYGYVQFKLYKKSSPATDGGSEKTTRAVTDKLDRLSDAQKIEVTLLSNGVTIKQTLKLNAYNEANAEFGMRSDKLQLLEGTYQITGFYLYDKVDELLYAGSTGSDNEFVIVEGGLQEKELSANATEQGMVKFRLKKDWADTRAGDNFLFKDINLMDVTVMNTFSRETTTFSDLKVTYKEEYEKETDENDPDNQYKEAGTAYCDTAVWLPAGTYRVTSYVVYKKSGGAAASKLEGISIDTDETFTVTDNAVNEDAIVPIQLTETAEHIKDYIALKKIWKALGGPNWSYYGDGYAAGINWDFNKEVDLWGEQPGVALDSKGRIISLSVECFGANGYLPDDIAQLSELQILALASHNEKLGGRIFDEKSGNMTPAQRHKVRMHYKETFLDYDPRQNLSEMIKESVNSDPKMKPISKKSRITLKDTQIGQTTNNIQFVSKAVITLKKLQQFYLANSPFKAEDICEKWAGEQYPDKEGNNEYYQKYKNDQNLKWENLTELVDLELYNCPKMTKFPKFLAQLPEVQLLNMACNPQIKSDDFIEGWESLLNAPIGGKLQILYFGYNSLKKFPDTKLLSNMKKLGYLECIHNHIGEGESEYTLPSFGKEVKLATLMLDYNYITEIPEDFCAFTNDVEQLSFANNRLKYIPNIFDASSVYVMGSVDFSGNQIGSDNDKNFKNPKDFKGINASTVSLANNKIKEFPKELFQTKSPITTIDLSQNRLTEVPDGAFKDPKTHLNYEKSWMLQIVDLRFNQLTKLSDDFRASTLPYLSNMDVSYNCFSEVPLAPLNSSQMKAFAIRHQRDKDGNRILRQWPEGITTCPSLIQFQIGSNDIRKVEEKMTPKLYIVDIKDNPNISIDMTSVCPYIQAGMYKLIYDKTQDIKGCDALDIKR